MKSFTSMFLTYFSGRVRRIFYYESFYMISFISRSLLKLVWNLYYLTKQMSDDGNQTMKFQREKSFLNWCHFDWYVHLNWTEKKAQYRRERVSLRVGERERLDHMSTLELMYWAALLCQPTWYFYSTDWTYKRGSRDKMSLQVTRKSVSLVKPLIYPMNVFYVSPRGNKVISLGTNQVLGIHYCSKNLACKNYILNKPLFSILLRV